jgi:hypothetical protein
LDKLIYYIYLIAYHKVMIIVGGIYKHLKSGRLYRVVNICRSVHQPEKQMVAYEQLYHSKLYGTDIDLPIGSMWVRDLEDFISLDTNGVKKFVRIDD